MPKVNEVLVRFDNDTELVIDEIGDDVPPIELGFRISSAIYRVIAGETEQMEGNGMLIGGIK